jgi:hypothetical protein
MAMTNHADGAIQDDGLRRGDDWLAVAPRRTIRVLSDTTQDGHTKGRGMSDERLYVDRYARFFKEREHAKGYEFQQAPAGNVPPPKVGFIDKLRWWTVNRGERLKKIRQERDRRVLDIVRLRNPPR